MHLLKLVLVFFIGFSAKVFAGDISWSGVYRFEANSIKNSELDSDKNYQKDYGLHHLVLMPKMVLSDGIYLNARLHLFNNEIAGNQLGQEWGGNTQSDVTNAYDSNSSAGRLDPETINVSELYANFNHEFGQFIIGRVPIDFGLGITYNDGHGMFDHWYDNRDMVAYKLFYGNLTAKFGYAKMAESTINANGDDINELSIHMQYNNVEAEFEAGAYYQLRKASATANNIAVQASAGDRGYGTVGSANDRELETKDFNVYIKRDRKDYSFGFEGAFHKGALGITDGDSGAGIQRDAFAFAGEYEYHPLDSTYAIGVKLGMATGDDPETKGEFEGFFFDRNYDVATLLFNHALGQDNFFGTAPNGGGGSSDNKGYDEEQISNVIYLAPYFTKRLSSKWVGQARFATGFLQQKIVSGSGSDLGYEIDLALTYSPYERLQWVNEFAYLLPGDAFKAGGTYKADNAMAFISKVAISF